MAAMKRPSRSPAAARKATSKATSPSPKAAPSKKGKAAAPSPSKARTKAPAPVPGTLLPPGRKVDPRIGQGVSGSDYHGKIRGRAQGCDGKPALFVGGSVVPRTRVTAAVRREEIALGLRPAPAPRGARVTDATRAPTTVLAVAPTPAKRESFGAGSPEAGRPRPVARHEPLGLPAPAHRALGYGAGTAEPRRMTTYGPAALRMFERFEHKPQALDPIALKLHPKQRNNFVGHDVESIAERYNQLDPHHPVTLRLSPSNDGTGSLERRDYANPYQLAEAVGELIDRRVGPPSPDARPILQRVMHELGMDKARLYFTLDWREGDNRIAEEINFHRFVRQLFAAFADHQRSHAFLFDDREMTATEAQRPLDIRNIRTRTVIMAPHSGVFNGVESIALVKYAGGAFAREKGLDVLPTRNDFLYFVARRMDGELSGKASKPEGKAPAAWQPDPEFRTRFGGGEPEAPRGRTSPRSSAGSPLEAFLAKLAPMQAGAARKALAKPMTMNNTNLRPTHEHVEQLVKAGATVEAPSRSENLARAPSGEARRGVARREAAREDRGRLCRVPAEPPARAGPGSGAVAPRPDVLRALRPWRARGAPRRHRRPGALPRGALALLRFLGPAPEHPRTPLDAGVHAAAARVGADVQLFRRRLTHPPADERAALGGPRRAGAVPRRG